jgi:type IV secretory pathway TrbD component
MNHAPNRNWGFAGLLAVVLWVVGIALETLHGPADQAGGAQILGFYKSHTDTILVGGWLFMLGCLAFLCLVAALRLRLEEAAGPLSPLPGLALVGAGVAATLAMLMAACDVAGAIDKSEIGPATAASFHHVIDLFFVGAELAAIVPVAAVAAVAWRTRVLPRWWAAFSVLVAVVLVIGPIGWAALIFGLPVWTLGTSLFVLLGRPQPRTSMAPATA